MRASSSVSRVWAFSGDGDRCVIDISVTIVMAESAMTKVQMRCFEIMSVGFGCSAGVVEVCFAALPIGSLEVVYAVAGYAVEVQSHDGVGEHVSLFFGEVVGAGDDLREGAFTALADGVPDLAV